jgi:rSAM/selenodomain-associated transferase 1
VSSLYLAAKAPVPGQVKTRLGAEIGMQAAADLYAAFLQDLVARFHEAGQRPRWHAAPGAWPALQPIVGGAHVREQRGDGWEVRQANLFSDCAVAGEAPVVLAATDSPQLDPATVEAAFAALEDHELVLGPTPDGGYYLIGMRGFYDVLTGTAMSTSATLAQVATHAGRLGLSVHLLEPEFDVDTAADLDELWREARRRPDLGCTLEALQRLRIGVPS